MEKLDALASLVRVGSLSSHRKVVLTNGQLSDRVVRILGQNPGKFTLQGTNTYLVGERPPYTLIDTGEGRPAYLPLLESALEHCPPAPASPLISDIILSHWHTDHIGGLSSVLTLLRTLWDAFNAPFPFQPPRIHKFPLSAPPGDSFARAVHAIQPGLYLPSPTGSLFHDLHDGQRFPITAATTAAFQVIHAPGHTQDSLAIWFPYDRVLYTADSVLGQGTAVFEDLAIYLSTLRTLLSCIDDDGDIALYPGHGPVVHNGKRVIKAYIDHRMERERQILQVMHQEPAKTWTTSDIVANIYATYPRELWEATAGSVNQHLRKLLAEGKVSSLGGHDKDAKWKLV